MMILEGRGRLRDPSESWDWILMWWTGTRYRPRRHQLNRDVYKKRLRLGAKSLQRVSYGEYSVLCRGLQGGAALELMILTD